MRSDDKMDINLLIVDEDTDTLEISKELLSRFVKKIYVSRDIKGANTYITNFKIDVIITDIRVGNGYGLALIKDTKHIQNEIYPILITSFGSEFIEYKEEIASLGITRFLTKPFKLAILLNMLSEIDMLKKTKNYYKNLQDINNTLENEVLRNHRLVEDKNYIISSQSKYVILGEMFSMIMHQIMQPIQAIKMTSSIIGFKAQRENLTKEFLMEQTVQISKSCDFLADTILSFRNFNKQDKRKEIVNLQDIIDDTIKLVKVTLEKNNITLKVFVSQEVPQMQTYKNELIQVILNLINNAKDALLINKIENPFISVEATYNEDKYTIVVTDNAGGVPKNIEKSIFKPHFTTKTDSGGSGLGLYMSKMIVESSLNGTIRLENIKDGASFVVVLQGER